jgi:tRNA pseudouridine32 synthase/23S rRNA pseudouridine746 synthase
MDEAWRYDPPDGPLIVVWVDRDLVVIDKPAGLLSVPGRGAHLADCAAARVEAQFGPVYPAHRLDMDTSGLLIFARRRKAEAALFAQFRERRVEKVYEARVEGHPADDAGIIDAALSLVPGAPRSCLDPAGKQAQTAWRLLSRDADGSALLALRPHTGRSHQLRLHLCSIGHPIRGDRLYAPPDVMAAAPRLLLHAAQITFAHPYSGARLELLAPRPFP